MFKYFIVVLKVLPSLIYSYFAWMIRYSKNPSKYPLELRFKKVQKIIRKVLKAFNVKIENNDLKDFYSNCKKDENYLFIANHLSDADPLIFIACAQRPITFVSKIENEKAPFVGRIIKILEGEFMDRDDLRQSFKVMKKVEEKLNSSVICDYMIFPEGTRNKNYLENIILPYHHGSFRPAIKANKNICAFAIFGSQYILSSKNNKRYFYVNLKKVCEIDKSTYLIESNTNKIAEDVMDKSKDTILSIKKINDELMS